jgi:hypothetical protein
MTRRSFNWLFTSSKPRRKQARRPLAIEGLSAAYGRTLRLEAVEPRMLLTHAAPVLNAADGAMFSSITENISVGSNTGETVGAMLATGGAIVADPPGGSYFMAIDETNTGQDGQVGQEGIAVTGLIGTNDGVWEYSTNGGSSWSLFAHNVSASNALVLSGSSSNDNLIRFLPNANFVGTVDVQFLAWDQTDGQTAGSYVNLSAPGATGGSTAYSTASSTAMLQVTRANVPPSFTLVPVADTVLENYADSNNPGGSDSYQHPVLNVASDIQLGTGGGNTVSFTVSDGGGNFGTLFSQAPTIDVNGTLNFTLNQNATGTATLKVTATNGTLTSAVETTQIVVEPTSPPSFTAGPNEKAAENGGPQTFTNWATNISTGTNGGSNSTLIFEVRSDSNPGLFSAAPSISYGGTLTFTPTANLYGQATITVDLYDDTSNVRTGTQTFTISVLAPPTGNPSYFLANYAQISFASAPGVLATDSDPNASPNLQADPNLVSNGSWGSVTLNSDGSFSYAPGANFPIEGLDQFTYKPQDGPAYGNATTVTVYTHGGALIAKIYQQMLHRAASNSDVGYWAVDLNSESNIGNITLVDKGVYNSAEYENPQVTSWFNGFLGRGPSQSDLNYWEGQWVSYESPEQVIIGIASTQEAFNHAQTQYHYSDQNENWVSLIYPPILNRQADSGALSYFTSELDGGYMTRAQVVQALADSNEYRDDVIQSFFQTFLMRSASQSDINYFQGLMDNYGYTQLQIQQAILDTLEYLDNPAAPGSGVATAWNGPSGY